MAAARIAAPVVGKGARELAQRRPAAVHVLPKVVYGQSQLMGSRCNFPN